MSYKGDFNTGATVRFKFTTNTGTGARTAPSSAFEAADLLIYKDDSDTERSSTNGVTITSTFDSKTGLHHVSIDLSENTDPGFYAAGHDYQVVLYPDETVDGVSIAAVVAEFSILNRSLAAYSSTLNTKLDTIDDLLDTEIAAIKSDTAAILDDTGTTGVVVAAGSKTGYELTSGERDSIAAALLDLVAGVESGLTVRQALRLTLAALAGKVSGGGSGTETFRNAIADTKDRMVVTDDQDGNRTAITYDLT